VQESVVHEGECGACYITDRALVDGYFIVGRGNCLACSSTYYRVIVIKGIWFEAR
jgi:hypothetical protein